MGALWADKKKKKIIVLKCLLLFYTTMNHFSIRLWCATKVDFIWQLVTQLYCEWATKHFSMPHLHQKQVMVAVWWSAACLIHYSFLNPRETITSEKYAQQISEMHQKLQWLQLTLVNRKGPILHHDKCLTAHHTASISKVEQIGQWSFASSAIFTWPLTSGLPLLQASWQLFTQKTLP